MRIKNILATLMVVLMVLAKLSPLLVVSYVATTSIGESIVVGEGERAVLSAVSENDTVNREPRITDYEVVEDERIVATGKKKSVIKPISKKVVSTVSKVVKNTVSKVGNAVKAVSKRVTSYAKGRVVKGRKR